MSNKMVIVVEGGCLVGVFDEQGNELTDNYWVIDYDNEENGICPVCQEDLVDGDMYKCESCGYVVGEDNWVEAVQNIKKEK